MSPVQGRSEYNYAFTQDSESMIGLAVSIEVSSDLLNWVQLDPERIEITENIDGNFDYQINTENLPVPLFHSTECIVSLNITFFLNTFWNRAMMSKLCIGDYF